jgi:hypothetical protein
MKRIISLILLVASLTLHAQVTRSSSTNNYIGSNCYSRNADVFSITRNQAALSSLKNFSAALYGERKFLMQDLSSYTAVMALPTSSGNFGLTGAYSGQATFNELKLSLAYGRNVGKKMDIGVQFNYIDLHAGEYGHASSVNFDAGVLFHLTDKVQSGIHISNPTGSKLGKSGEEHLPTLYSCGLGYDVSDMLYIGAEMEKVEQLPLNVNTGVRYVFDENLVASAGLSLPTSVFYFGIGLLLKDFKINVSANVHPYLGITPGLLMIYSSVK